MDVLVDRVAGLDVHKKTVTACVRVPGEGRERVEHKVTFPTFRADLEEMRDWLAGHDVSLVVMEATGVFWKPIWMVLEDAEAFELKLVNARHVKQVPGRKTDVGDAAWLARLAECGLLRGSFIPPREIRELRDLTRYKKRLIQDQTHEGQRVEKVLAALPALADIRSRPQGARLRRSCASSSPLLLGVGSQSPAGYYACAPGQLPAKSRCSTRGIRICDSG